MSIAQNYPAISPSLSLDFAAVQALDSRVTFTRASTATYYGTQTAMAEQNLLIRSQDFNVGGWSATGCVMTGDALAAPDGTTTAELLTANTTGTAGISQTITTGAVPHTFSVFAKAGTCTWLRLLSVSGTNNAWFDLTNGVLGTVQGSTTATITSVGNGWYRCSVTSSVGGPTAFIRLANADASTTADDTTTLYVWGAQLEQRSAVTAYTPTTTQPITNYIPVLQTAASGVARFDHNPTTFESLGLLIEESRTNLFTYSEQFDNAAWSKTAASITADAVVSPDGTMDADKLVEDATTANHLIAQSASVTSGTAYTASFYAKKAERTQCALLFAAAGFGTATVDIFDLDAGTVVTNASGTAAITAVGNDWYRVSATRTATATASPSFQIRLANAGVTNYLGNGYSGIYIWGAQLEAGAFATSYIPTVASQVTRAADAASMTGTNFSSWYNQAEGSFYSEYLPNAVAPSSAAQLIFMASDGTTSNSIELFKRANADVSTRFSVASGGVNQVFANLGVFTATATKAAIAYSANDFAGLINAGTAVTDTSGNTPLNVSQMDIGRFVTASGYLNGHIQRIVYYPRRLSNAELQGITS